MRSLKNDSGSLLLLLSVGELDWGTFDPPSTSKPPSPVKIAVTSLTTFSLVTCFAEEEIEGSTEKVTVRRRSEIDRFRMEGRGERRCVIASQHDGQCMFDTRRDTLGRCRRSSDMAKVDWQCF